MNNVLPSVMQPDIVHEVELSRFGDWLFASQQQLDEYDSFRALSLPADELFKQGELFMQELNSGADDAMLNARISGFDAQFSRIVQLLHELERDILLDTTQRY